MKSQALNWLPFQEVMVPDDLLTVEYTSDEAIEQPFLDFILSEYNEQNGTNETELSDEVVLVLNDDHIKNISDARAVGREIFMHRERENKIYNKIIPYLRKYYGENSNVVINSNELEAYTEGYVKDLKTAAQAAEVSLREYVIGLYELKEDTLLGESIDELARTDFIFKLIASDYYIKQGNSLDYETYEQIINRSVLQNRADEIELRDNFSYQDFLNTMPELYFINDIVEYFSPQIIFKSAEE